MAPIALVGLSLREQAQLGDLHECIVIEATSDSAVRHALGHIQAPEMIVIGTQVHDPVRMVQQAHRAYPAAAIVIALKASDEAVVRRAVSTAPNVPASLRIITLPDAHFSEQVRQLRHNARTAARNREVLRTITVPVGREVAELLAASPLGALLEQAALGVVVADARDCVVGWNDAAQTLLALSDLHRGAALSTVLTGVANTSLTDTTQEPNGLLVAPSRPPFLTSASDGRPLEVSTVSTTLENGASGTLLLLVDISARRAAETVRDTLASQMHLLSGLSDALGDTLDLDVALRRLVSYVVPVLADWAAVELIEPRGDHNRIIVGHPDSRAIATRLRDELTTASVQRAAAAARALAVGAPHDATSSDDHEDALRSPRLRALAETLGSADVLTPAIVGREGVLGWLLLARDSGQYGPESAGLARELGRRAGVALDNARLYGRQHTMAVELQQSLLTEPPQPTGLQIVVRYVAAGKEAAVGGDWYDAFLQPDGTTVVAIGDVIGHDTRAAAAMGQLRGLLRGIAYASPDSPASTLQRLDHAIAGLQIDTSATVVVGHLTAACTSPHAPRHFRWSNAGHPPPVAVQRDGRLIALDRHEPNLLLGIRPVSPRTEHEIVLDAGSTVFLYTDGLVERRDRSLDDGVRLLSQALSRSAADPLESLCDAVLRQLLPDEPEDDVALIAIRLLY